MCGVEVVEEVRVDVEDDWGRGEVDLALLHLEQGRLVREQGREQVGEDLGVLRGVQLLDQLDS